MHACEEGDEEGTLLLSFGLANTKMQLSGKYAGLVSHIRRVTHPVVSVTEESFHSNGTGEKSVGWEICLLQ